MHPSYYTYKFPCFLLMTVLLKHWFHINKNGSAIGIHQMNLYAVDLYYYNNHGIYQI